jgi:hypothetical protein
MRLRQTTPDHRTLSNLRGFGSGRNANSFKKNGSRRKRAAAWNKE